MDSDSLSNNAGRNGRFRAYSIQMIIVCCALLVAFGIVELFLRSFPGLIGLQALSQMDPSLRGEIAERLNLPTRSRMSRLTSEMRSDHGPSVFMPRPNAQLIQYNEKKDVELGALQVVQVDKNGFCNSPEKAERATAQVLVAGDSFTFCTAVGAAGTATAKLEEMSGLSVYNLGVGGVGPDVYLELLKKYAPRFHPKVAVMDIYEGNDLRDVLVKRKFMEGGRDTRRQRRPGWLSRSYAIQFVLANVRLAVKGGEQALVRKDNINFRYSAPINGQAFAMNLSNMDGDEVRHALAIQKKEISFDEFRESLSDFVKWSRENKITPIVTYIPSMYTVYEGTVTFEDPEVGSAVQAFSAEQRRWLAKETNSVGLNFRDLTPAFQQAAAKGVLTHFPGNVHLTPAGHEIVARQMLEMIQRVASLQ